MRPLTFPLSALTEYEFVGQSMKFRIRMSMLGALTLGTFRTNEPAPRRTVSGSVARRGRTSRTKDARRRELRASRARSSASRRDGSGATTLESGLRQMTRRAWRFRTLGPVRLASMRGRRKPGVAPSEYAGPGRRAPALTLQATWPPPRGRSCVQRRHTVMDCVVVMGTPFWKLFGILNCANCPFDVAKSKQRPPFVEVEQRGR
jgi:hypothetical protein